MPEPDDAALCRMVASRPKRQNSGRRFYRRQFTTDVEKLFITPSERKLVKSLWGPRTSFQGICSTNSRFEQCLRGLTHGWHDRNDKPSLIKS